MGISLSMEKLNRKYNKYQNIIGLQGYWSHIKRAQETKANPTRSGFSSLEQETSCVMYCLEIYIHYNMLDYVKDEERSKEAWKNL